ncbi:MAG: MFS transporter [Lachnospiraceae bacterium]|nr:MFS transporter [Lachnospiraceae bacterium]MDD3615406.1 MFS transporter [Lachnospiraceae bacterium]
MGEEKTAKKVSSTQKRFFGIGDFGFTLMSNIDTFYATYFFTNIAKFSLGIVTTITTISAIVDAILSCLYGAWMNKIKPKKWGRYRSWLILTPWMVPFLYALQFFKINNGIGGIIVMTVAMITSRIAWNIPYIANISMINVAGKTTEDRMALSSTRMVWTSLGSVIYSYAGPIVVALFANMLGESNAYAATAFVFAALMAAGYFAHFKMFTGYEETGEEELARLQKEAAARAEDKKQQKVSAWAAIRCNPHLIGLIFSSTTKYMVLFLVNGIAVYYFTYISHNPALLATFVLITNLLGVVASYVSKYVVAKLSAKSTIVYGYLVMAVGMIIAFLIYQNTWGVIALMCLVVFAMTLTNACEPELFANCAGYSSAKTGYDTTGTVMGLLTVPVKVGIVMRGILIGAALAIGGFSADIDPATASEAVQRGICIGFMIIPAVVIFVGAMVLLFGYRLDRENVG